MWSLAGSDISKESKNSFDTEHAYINRPASMNKRFHWSRRMVTRSWRARSASVLTARLCDRALPGSFFFKSSLKVLTSPLFEPLFLSFPDILGPSRCFAASCRGHKREKKGRPGDQIIYTLSAFSDRLTPFHNILHTRGLCIRWLMGLQIAYSVQPHNQVYWQIKAATKMQGSSLQAQFSLLQPACSPNNHTKAVVGHWAAMRHASSDYRRQPYICIDPITRPCF